MLGGSHGGCSGLLRGLVDFWVQPRRFLRFLPGQSHDLVRDNLVKMSVYIFLPARPSRTYVDSVVRCSREACTVHLASAVLRAGLRPRAASSRARSAVDFLCLRRTQVMPQSAAMAAGNPLAQGRDDREGQDVQLICHSAADLQPAGEGLVPCEAGAPLVAQLRMRRLRQPRPRRLHASTQKLADTQFPQSHRALSCSLPPTYALCIPPTVWTTRNIIVQTRLRGPGWSAYQDPMWLTASRGSGAAAGGRPLLLPAPEGGGGRPEAGACWKLGMRLAALRSAVTAAAPVSIARRYSVCRPLVSVTTKASDGRSWFLHSQIGDLWQTSPDVTQLITRLELRQG